LDGKPIKEQDNRFKISSVPEAGMFGLEIVQASRDLNGILECHAENDFGEAVSKAKLTVVTPVKAPVVKNGLEDVQVNEDENLNLKVRNCKYLLTIIL